MSWEIAPVTAERWDDLAGLFAAKPCFCMLFRRAPGDCDGGAGGNKAAMREIVMAGKQPGLIAYDADGPVGWVSVAPREEFLPRLERSQLLKPAPGEGIWSVLCFYIKPGHRRQGMAAALLDAAVGYAREHGAAAVEGAALEPGVKRIDTSSAYTGVVGMFRGAGFTEIGRRGSRPIYRLTFGDRRE
jgi:ribosomal protein S18 acetylase RimI-like enzyme